MSDDDLLFDESLIRPAGRYPVLPSAFRDRVVRAAVRASRERTRNRRIWLVGSVLMLLSFAGGQMLSNFAQGRWNASLETRNERTVTAPSVTAPSGDAQSTGPERMAVLGNSDPYLIEVRKQLLKRREIFLGIF